MKIEKSSAAIFAALWTAGTTLAGAQTAQTSEPREGSEVGGLQEIIVTAQRREQSVGDVGIFIQAASAEQLTSRGVDQITELPKLVPGLVTARTIGGYEIFSLRGVNFNSTQISAAPVVSTYVDEAALPYGSMTAGLFLDVERVEVLKGPQGTLYGQNATGGSVNVIAAKPTDHLAAGIQQSFNDFGESDTKGYISGPLSETLRARFAFSTTHGGAWQKGYFATDRKVGKADRNVGRILLDWTPVESLKVSVNLNYNNSKGEGQAFQLAKIAPQLPSGALPEYLSYPLPPKSDRAADIDGPQDQDHWTKQGVVRADYDINENLKLTSITNTISNQHDQFLDNDSTTIDVSTGEHFAKARSFNQEIRLAGNLPDAHVFWIVGGNYQNDHFFEQDLIHLTHYSSLPGVSLRTHYDETNKSQAAFANVDWEMTPGLTLTTGLRYTDAKQTTDGCSSDTGDGTFAGFINAVSNAIRGAQGLAPTSEHLSSACNSMNNVPSTPGAPADFLPARVQLKQSEDNVAWRAGLNYKPVEDVLVYGLISRGFKAGVFPFQDTIVVTQTQPVRQEELTDYEIGVKSTMLNRRLNVDAAAFYYDYKDKQFFTYVTLPFIGQAPTLTNIPKAKLKGADLSIAYQPIPELTFRGGVTYVDTQVGSYRGVNVLNQTVDFTGKKFNFAPPWSGSMDAEYRRALTGSTQGFVGASAWFNSRTFGDLANSPDSVIPGFTVYDARLGVDSDRGWQAFLWVRNLTNKYYWTSLGVASDNLFKYTGLPRTFGITGSYRF